MTINKIVTAALNSRAMSVNIMHALNCSVTDVSLLTVCIWSIQSQKTRDPFAHVLFWCRHGMQTRPQLLLDCVKKHNKNEKVPKWRIHWQKTKALENWIHAPDEFFQILINRYSLQPADQSCWSTAVLANDKFAPGAPVNADPKDGLCWGHMP